MQQIFYKRSLMISIIFRNFRLHIPTCIFKKCMPTLSEMRRFCVQFWNGSQFIVTWNRLIWILNVKSNITLLNWTSHTSLQVYLNKPKFSISPWCFPHDQYILNYTHSSIQLETLTNIVILRIQEGIGATREKMVNGFHAFDLFCFQGIGLKM